MRKQFFLSIFNARIHLSRWKGIVKITCFDEQDQILGLNQDVHSEIIYNYLLKEGFVSEDEEVKFTFCENLD